VRERQYADNTTMLAELGVIKAPTRPLLTAAAAPIVVLSTGADTERAAVETFRANMAAFNAHDVKALAAMNASDAVFHDYTQAKEAMIRRTDTEWAPWTTVKSNDKKRARINAMRAFLWRFEYEGKDAAIVGRPDPRIVQRGIVAVGD